MPLRRFCVIIVLMSENNAGLTIKQEVIIVIEKDDWRLRGQEKYLSNKDLFLRQWKAPRPDWDHDHCEFCWAKFSDAVDVLHEGYTTEDNYYWICPDCYNDFKELFGWIEKID